MKKALKYCRILFAVYLAMYLVCNAAFSHNHIIDGHSISHAHPFKGVQHTAGNAETIKIFNATAALVPQAVAAPGCILFFIGLAGEFSPQQPVPTKPDAECLRGPPTFQV